MYKILSFHTSKSQTGSLEIQNLWSSPINNSNQEVDHADNFNRLYSRMYE
jgi:hypothetical protein